MVNDIVLYIKDLRKVYGNFTALSGISFEVQRGEIFGLLGPNGAGKTTSLECLEGIRQADGGEMNILGINPAKEQRKLPSVIGVQLQTSSLPGEMHADEAMKFFCAYHHVAPRYDLLDRLGLQEKRHSPYQGLSTGQQRRLALALAIAHDPPVVILDEPTAGLDVASRTELHIIMEELKDRGTSILLATHDMAEAEKMADRVAILLKGKVVASGTPLELTATGAGLTKISVRTEESLLNKNGATFPAVSQKAIDEDYSVYFSRDAGPTVTAVLEYIRAHGDKLIDLRVERPSLEERFLEITHSGGSK